MGHPEHSPPLARPRRNTTRQREAGQAARAETRRRLVQAAGELFAELGYPRTTVTAIAERAGVSLQTLYLAGGSKRQLLRAHLENALSGTSEGIDDTYVGRIRETVTTPADPAEQLRVAARVFRLVAERSAPAWQLYRNVAAIEPDVALDWRTLQQLRRTTYAAALAALPDTHRRPGLAQEDVVDTAWTIASPETYDLLVRHAGYSLDRYEAWLGDTLIAAILQA